MKALEFWKVVVVDRDNLLEGIIELLAEHGIRYCAIGGQAVNAYAEPVVSLDLDLVVAVEQIDYVEALFADQFEGGAGGGAGAFDLISRLRPIRRSRPWWPGAGS